VVDISAHNLFVIYLRAKLNTFFILKYDNNQFL
jgi:hypothetical protein